jgi:hypothetical protein
MSDERFPAELADRERALVEQRRRAAGRPGVTDEPVLGLALSGGGIRSATLSVGMLQALAEADALARVDYLSTVSGGGYAGAFLGGLHQERRDDGTTAPATPAAVAATLRDPWSFPMSWLRENGRYIAPNGAADIWIALAAVLRNLVAVHVVLSVTALTALLGGLVLRRSAWLAMVTLGFEDVARAVDDVAASGVLWWSPWCLLPAASLPLLCLPPGIAYWLVRRDGKEDGGDAGGMPPWLTALIVFAAAAAAAATAAGVAAGVFALAALVVALSLAVWAFAARLGRASSAEARNRLTSWLRTGLVLTLLSAAFAVIDTVGQTLYAAAAARDERARLYEWAAGAFGAVAAVAAGAQRLLGKLADAGKGRLAVPVRALAPLAALIVVGAMLSALSAIAHALAWADPEPFPNQPVLWLALAAALTLTVCFGRTHPFLNRSTLAALYGARLTRAYLGASNARRRHPGNQNVTRLLAGDQIDFSGYEPHRHGGPLHIFNVTLNETVSGQSQVEQRDRRGMNLAIGPAGASVAARHHALWKLDGTGQRTNQLAPLAGPAPGERFMVFPPGAESFASEPLDVGQWVAISGAAVSPGLGWRTSVGLSLLTGLLNIRLGRWWQSGVDPALRARAVGPARVGAGALRNLGRALARLGPVQAHLLDELLARFHGPARRFWYLSDGGHFENTGGYELLRRRVPVALLCDHTGDGPGGFTDVADLVRKARTDFGAEIAFLDDAARTQALAGVTDAGQRARVLSHLGDLEDLGFGVGEDGGRRAGDRFAALARVTHRDGETTWLVVIKPRVTPGLSIDLRAYAHANPEFPRQPISDQFFDDRQWESHRKLGQEIGRALFPAGAAFWPALLPRAPGRGG